MDRKAVSFRIFLWIEVIVAARILLFAVPVMIDKLMAGSASYDLGDWFLLSFAVPCIFYLAVGIVTLLGSSAWKALHFLVVFMSLTLAATFLSMVFRTQSPVQGYYFVPGALAVLILGYLLTLRQVPLKA